MKDCAAPTEVCRFTLFVLGMFSFFFVQVTSAQSPGEASDIALLPVQFKLTRLAHPPNGSWAGLASFHVDAASGTRLWFRIRASSPLVKTWIQVPVQPLEYLNITKDGVGGFGGTYMTFEGGEPGPFILPTNDPGFQYIYDFPSVGPGQYSVYLIADPSITGDVAVITELMSESPVAVTLMAVTPEVAVGQTAVLTAVVFDGTNPVHGAKVPVTIISPSGAVSTLTLYDDGELPKGDHLARDGLYSGVFIPTEAGEYTIHAKITGFRGSNSVYFERDAGASVRVYGPCVALTGFLADYGQDDNDNGRYEWLVIEAEVTVSSPSEWILQAILKTETGKTLSAYGRGEATTLGVQAFKARVSSDAIHAAGEPGPLGYRVVDVQLSCVGEEGAIPAGRLMPNTNTFAYRLEQFEPPPQLDCNSNGIGDLAEIQYGLTSDCDGNQIPDECEAAPVVPGGVAWNVDAVAPDRTTRSLRFTVQPQPGGGSDPVAIKVTMIDLQNPVPPNLPQFPPPDFSAYEFGLTCTDPSGCSRWVGKPGTFYESQGPPLSGPYRAARLQCTPFYWDWTSEPGGVVIVVGAEIMPSSEYSVQTYGSSCDGCEALCANVSTAVTMYTRRSGDVDEEYNPPSSTNQPNAVDIAQLVNKFKNIVGAPVHARTQLQPNLPELNASVNALDIVASVDAVKGFAYPYSGPCPCPSTVICGQPCTGCTGLCVKTCVGGDNVGQPCVNGSHCPGGQKVCDGGDNNGVPCDDEWDCLTYGTCAYCPEAGTDCCDGDDTRLCTPESGCPNWGICSSPNLCGTGTCRDQCGRCRP